MIRSHICEMHHVRQSSVSYASYECYTICNHKDPNQVRRLPHDLRSSTSVAFMGNYFTMLHPVDHLGGRVSRQDDGHGTTMYSDVEAEAMLDCALAAMKVQCAAMEIAIQRYSRNNEI